MPADPDLLDLKVTIYRRLYTEKRWEQAKPIRDELIREARAAGMKRDEAQRRAWQEIDAMFPPLPPDAMDSEPDDQGGGASDDEQQLAVEAATRGANEALEELGGVSDGLLQDAEPTAVTAGRSRARSGDEPPVVGLGEIPPQWPPLPPNAPLGTEIQWVQANRLRCIRDEGDRTVVDLSKAMAAAPSYAALGWLETSIRVFSKFVDVAAKVTSQMQDEQEHARRERVAIEDVRRLLSEMLSE